MKRDIKYRHKRQGGISKRSKVSSVLDPIEDCWEIRAEEWTSEKGKKNGRNRRQERRALKSGQKGSEKIQTLRDQGQAKQLIVSGLEQIVHLSDLTFVYRFKNRILTVG